MKTLAKYHICNRYVMDGKTFKNILIGPGKLPGLSRNGPQAFLTRYSFAFVIFCCVLSFVFKNLQIGVP